MEITKSSFKRVFPLVEEVIRRCTFISIDGEYSGLYTNKSKSIAMADDMQQRYEKIRDSSQAFSFLQFGMTAFTWDPSTSSFDVKPFSFYLFSDPSKLLGLDRRFSFQASSASFLADFHFNFNKVFHEGIQFLNRSEENNFRQRSAEPTSQNPNVLVPPEHAEFVNSNMSNIESWITSESSMSLELPKMNSFRRLLMYQQIRTK
ncbi:putative ribonuclease [Mitosporidium daphniae]|uniref:Putative ribonuclease n=1 Tax=Mitosporidium daphniae TaxID=1485682 RepID=A0A098VV80_9MICR|nr:putative ribonuclease [Mitosporidium daphniae]KGG52769.1 putative ribonuclease [Mitosporidium daphniae]|eukprot:XP_013239205.1 putative ribonuclease [Mitosporidium daphniae]